MLLGFFVMQKNLLLSCRPDEPSVKHVQFVWLDDSFNSTVKPTSICRSKSMPLEKSEILLSNVLFTVKKTPKFCKETRYPSSNSVALGNRNCKIGKYNLPCVSPTFDKKEKNANTFELSNNDYSNESFSDVLLDGCREFKMPQNQENNFTFSKQPYLQSQTCNGESDKSIIEEQIEESVVESTNGKYEFRKANSF